MAMVGDVQSSGSHAAGCDPWAGGEMNLFCDRHYFLSCRDWTRTAQDRKYQSAASQGRGHRRSVCFRNARVTLQTMRPWVTQSRGASAKPRHGCVGSLEDGSEVTTRVQGPVLANERCAGSDRFARSTCSASLIVVYLPRWARKTREARAAPRHAPAPTGGGRAWD